MAQLVLSRELMNYLLDDFSKHEIYNFVAYCGVDDTKTYEEIKEDVYDFVQQHTLPSDVILCPVCGERMEREYDYNSGLLRYTCNECDFYYTE